MTVTNNINQFKEGGFVVRVTSETSTMSYTTHLAYAQEMVRFALEAATHASSERLMATFILDQIDGRDAVIEAAMDQANPGYIDDLSHKIMLFALTLLFMRPELAQRIQSTLRQGGCSIVIQLHLNDVHVHLARNGLAFETAYILRDPSTETTKFH